MYRVTRKQYRYRLRYSARVYIYVYAYVYVHIHTRAAAQARDPVITSDDSPIDQRQEQAMYLVLVFGLLGSLACLLRARAREPNRPKTRTKYIAQSPQMIVASNR